MMAQKKLTSKEESFAQAYIFHKCDSIEAYRNSEYSQELKPDQMSVQAYKLLQKPHIDLRIKELQDTASAVAKEVFTITVEWRLRLLKDIADAGMGDYMDAQGNKRKENLAASKGAIETMNTMLGTKEESDKTIKPIAIGVVDAS
jgi:hypothetical protein